MSKKEVVGSMSEWSGVLKDFFRQINDGSKTIRQVQLFLENKNPFSEQKGEVSISVFNVRPNLFFNALFNLFDRQIQTLRGRGCPDQVLAMLIGQKPQVLTKAMTMSFKENRIPFLPIIPFSVLNPSTQMAMVKNGNHTGFTNLEANEISNVVSVPTQPYFIFDVEDGQDMLGRTVRKATELIKSQDRSPLTAPEVISLCIQTDVLSKHCVDASGSRCKGDDYAPYLCLNDSQPRLSWFDAGISVGRWGSASCGSRS